MFCIGVEKVVRHTENTATIFFSNRLNSYPGQFVMLNVFGYEEIPLSLSSSRSVTVKAVGETTKALVSIQEKSLVGLRGPMGKPFSYANGKALIVAGGIGIAPMLYLHDNLTKRGVEVSVLYGAKTSEELIWTDRFKILEVATDDGSAGFHGSVVELLKEKDLKGFSKIYCCGPEVMLRKLYNYLSNYLNEENKALSNVEFSLERYMRCGIGLCGSCVLENGLRVCAEGPVFSVAELDW
jgi:dihydroorotate dehydrogenase electron transfer subunit